MFHKELASMLARTRAGMLHAQPDNFSLRDVDRDLNTLQGNGIEDYLKTYSVAVTKAYLELNHLNGNRQPKQGGDSWE